LPAETVQIDADPVRLSQIFENILQNSIRFTDAGGEIHIAVQRSASHAEISIRDTGIGIKADQLDSIFEPYWQSETSSRNNGLGLGLALVKRLVKLHDGAVSASSPGLGLGTEFRVTLPLATNAQPVVAVSETTATVGHRILVVDDEKDVADMFSGLLQSLGQHTEVAYSGESAIELARQQKPEIAFLDLSMPGMNGHELARQLRELYPNDTLTLVALTGHRETYWDRLSHEFDHYLLKPTDLGTVVGLLNSL
jgi:CheY-like chemotaxis protein